MQANNQSSNLESNNQLDLDFESKLRDNDYTSQNSKDLTSAKDFPMFQHRNVFQPSDHVINIEEIALRKDNHSSNLRLSNLSLDSNQQLRQNIQDKQADEDHNEGSDSDQLEEVQDEEAQTKELPKIFYNANIKNNQSLFEDFQGQGNKQNLQGVNAYLLERLKNLGYQERQILTLINYQNVKSIEQAVDFLNKDANGWHHPFVSQKFFQSNYCMLCGDTRPLHKEIEEDKYQQLRNQDNNEPLMKDFCGICYQQLLEEDLILLRCGHMFCEECLRQYIGYQVTNDKVSQLICPYTDCQNEISIQLLQKHLMSSDVYEKYLKFMKRQEIYRNPDVKGCPTADCEGFLHKPQLQFDNKDVICNQCEKTYCFSCLHEPHEDVTCEELIEKDYEQWAAPNSDVGVCKDCGIRIVKEGGCPNMTCQKCKHEWCWICNEDFPVHTPECPNYHQYLEILEFQGMQGEIHPNGWFIYGRDGKACYWVFSMIFLLIVALPFVIVINTLLTPCYCLMMIVSCCGINRQRFKTWWGVLLTIFIMMFLYASIPLIFCMVTIPQISIFSYKKMLELKDLLRNRCKYYRKLGVSPIMNRYFDKIGLR